MLHLLTSTSTHHHTTDAHSDMLEEDSSIQTGNILPIITYPHPLLRQRSASVDTFDHHLLQLANNMIATMNDAGGIGIAAVQVGVLLRIIVVDMNAYRDPDDTQHADPHHTNDPNPEANLEKLNSEATPALLVMVNPMVVDLAREHDTQYEGCLSIPDVTYDVTRPQAIVVSYCDITGNTHKRSMNGLPARCVQHEIDHLNGVLFWDHCTRLRRQRLIKAYQHQQQSSRV